MMIFAVAEEGRKGEPMVDKELIESYRKTVKPVVASWLFNINYEHMGEQDKEEFERDFDEILDLALIGLKHKAQLLQERTEKRTETRACDCISRKDAIRWIKTECNPYGKPTLDFESGKRVMKHLEQMPPAQPEYEPVTAEDFAKTMSVTTAYSFMAWYGTALALMERQGFVICKKTM